MNLRFEYGVILNGSQTEKHYSYQLDLFEYGVILNGSQTATAPRKTYCKFEYGVILNGSQTASPAIFTDKRLSMV